VIILQSLVITKSLVNKVATIGLIAGACIKLKAFAVFIFPSLRDMLRYKIRKASIRINKGRLLSPYY